MLGGVGGDSTPCVLFSACTAAANEENGGLFSSQMQLIITCIRIITEQRLFVGPGREHTALKLEEMWRFVCLNVRRRR